MTTEDLIQLLQNLFQSATDDETLALFQSIVQWAAIVLSALAGVYAARRRGMDFFGVLVIAFVTCIGGGTLRDILLNRHPIFWLRTPVYFMTVLVISIVGMYVIRSASHPEKFTGHIVKPIEKMMEGESLVFVTIDALALGLWAYLGTTFALIRGVHPLIAPVMGVITAVFGGVVRDVFFATIPQQFLPGQLYAMAAAIGSIVFVVFWWLGQATPVGFLACLALTFLIRMAAVKFNISSS